VSKSDNYHRERTLDIFLSALGEAKAVFGSIFLSSGLDAMGRWDQGGSRTRWTSRMAQTPTVRGRAIANMIFPMRHCGGLCRLRNPGEEWGQARGIPAQPCRLLDGAGVAESNSAVNTGW